MREWNTGLEEGIEERAKEYTYRYATPFLSGFETAEYEAYKAGATEQKALDIEKACEWLEKYMESLGYIDEWCRTGEDKFKKAMEE